MYSQEQIRKRMAKAFGYYSHLLESVLSKCAEVSEAMMFEVLEREEPTVVIQRRNWCSTQSYYCSSCRQQKVRTQHNYCPHCGHKIQWIN